MSAIEAVADLPRPVRVGMVESRMGAVAWGLWPALRFPPPLIKPNVPISGIRLSDWLHRKAHGGRPAELMSCDDVSVRNSLRLAIRAFSDRSGS